VFGLAVVLLCLAPQPPRAERPTPAQLPGTRFVDVGGHRLRARVAGSGTPVVVLDAGLGDSGEISWREVFAPVAGFTTVVWYDRAGLGESEPGAAPRSYTQAATEMRALLRGLGLAPPYVLAGHSLGAAHIRAFASLYKDEVAGLVFVDPVCEECFPADVSRIVAEEEERLRDAPAAVKAEARSLWADAAQGCRLLRSYGPPPDVPLQVLVAGRDRPPGWVRNQLASYGSWGAQASEGGLTVTPDSTHYLQLDEPALVVAAIRRVVFPGVEPILRAVLRAQGGEAAVARYRELRRRYPADLFSESTLNRLGLEELAAQRLPAAVALLRLNVEMYPRAFNTHDSLGEAYMVQGDRPAAEASYRRSLELNPRNANAAHRLEKLRAMATSPR